MITARKRASRNHRGSVEPLYSLANVWATRCVTFWNKVNYKQKNWTFSFSHFCWVFQFLIKIRENARWNIANMTQIWKISHYFGTFQYFQLFCEKFPKLLKRNKTGWVLTKHSSFPQITHIFWPFEKLWSFSYFRTLKKIQHLARFSGLDLLISKILRQCEETSRKFLGVKIYVKYKLDRFFELEKKVGKNHQNSVKLSKILYTISYINT